MRQEVKHSRRFVSSSLLEFSTNICCLGLSVHMNQVHKENLTSVENALPNRQGLDVEIFGMEGVPEDIAQQHNQRIIQNFYTAQAERFAATGNPPPGQSGVQGPQKKIKKETPEELKARLAEHRTKTAAQKAAGINGTVVNPAVDGQSPGQGVSGRANRDGVAKLIFVAELSFPSSPGRLPLPIRRCTSPRLPCRTSISSGIPDRPVPPARCPSAASARQRTTDDQPAATAAVRRWLLQRKRAAGWLRAWRVDP